MYQIREIDEKPILNGYEILVCKHESRVNDSDNHIVYIGTHDKCVQWLRDRGCVAVRD